MCFEHIEKCGARTHAIHTYALPTFSYHCTSILGEKTKNGAVLSLRRSFHLHIILFARAQHIDKTDSREICCNFFFGSSKNKLLLFVLLSASICIHMHTNMLNHWYVYLSRLVSSRIMCVWFLLLCYFCLSATSHA